MQIFLSLTLLFVRIACAIFTVVNDNIILISSIYSITFSSMNPLCYVIITIKDTINALILG